LRRSTSGASTTVARAADNLLTLTLPLDLIIAQDRLREILGVGDATPCSSP
jgi:hypothetical protein